MCVEHTKVLVRSQSFEVAYLQTGNMDHEDYSVSRLSCSKEKSIELATLCIRLVVRD